MTQPEKTISIKPEVDFPENYQDLDKDWLLSQLENQEDGSELKDDYDFIWAQLPEVFIRQYQESFYRKLASEHMQAEARQKIERLLTPSQNHRVVFNKKSGRIQFWKKKSA